MSTAEAPLLLLASFSIVMYFGVTCLPSFFWYCIYCIICDEEQCSSHFNGSLLCVVHSHPLFYPGKRQIVKPSLHDTLFIECTTLWTARHCPAIHCQHICPLNTSCMLCLATASSQHPMLFVFDYLSRT